MSAALRQIAAAGAPTPVAAPDAILRRAMRRAADHEIGLDLSIESVCVDMPDLGAVLDDIAEHELLVGLERDGALAGLVILAPEMWSAIVEMQTVRQVLTHGTRPRAPRRSDATLCGPLITRLLDEITAVDADTKVEGWYEGLRLGAQITLRRMVELTLPAGAVRQVRLDCTYEGLAAPGRVCLIATEPAPAPPPEAAPPEEAWREQWRGAAEQASARLHAILHRMPMNLSTLKALEPGQVIALGEARLTGLCLETAAGRPVCQGRLGRVTGYRAVRLELPPPPTMEEIHLGDGSVPAGGAELPLVADGALDLPGSEPPMPGGDLSLPEPSLAPMSGLDDSAGDLAMADSGGLGDLAMPEMDASLDLPDTEAAAPLADLPEPAGLEMGELPEPAAFEMGDLPEPAGLDMGDLPEPAGLDMGDLPPLDLSDMEES